MLKHQVIVHGPLSLDRKRAIVLARQIRSALRQASIKHIKVEVFEVIS